MNLPKVITRISKRQGQGHGSGKGGHTSGRGMKGQKARTGVSILFEGYKVRKSLYKRLPLKRGKDKFKANGKPFPVDSSLLNLFKDGDVVNLETLANLGIVAEKDARKFGVKILGSSEIVKKLDVQVSTSQAVAKMVEKAGGTIAAKKAPRTTKFKKAVVNAK
jgi:large subunit ribosomal protein L15